jgi:hypothetical protein
MDQKPIFIKTYIRFIPFIKLKFKDKKMGILLYFILLFLPFNRNLNKLFFYIFLIPLFFFSIKINFLTM